MNVEEIENIMKTSTAFEVLNDCYSNKVYDIDFYHYRNFAIRFFQEIKINKKDYNAFIDLALKYNLLEIVADRYRKPKYMEESK